MKFSWPML